jgi:hypothetical protein
LYSVRRMFFLTQAKTVSALGPRRGRGPKAVGRRAHGLRVRTGAAYPLAGSVGLPGPLFFSKGLLSRSFRPIFRQQNKANTRLLAPARVRLEAKEVGRGPHGSVWDAGARPRHGQRGKGGAVRAIPKDRVLFRFIQPRNFVSFHSAEKFCSVLFQPRNIVSLNIRGGGRPPAPR